MAIDFSNKNIIVQRLSANWINTRDITLEILRLDLIDPVISGNKWYKLKENIRLAQQEGKPTLLTFGGIWSNHLIATAAAAKMLGINSIGMVCNFHDKVEKTKTLKACQDNMMQLIGLTRAEYRQKNDSKFLEHLQYEYPNAYIIPEGGNNAAGIRGASEIASFIPKETTHIAMSIGSGTTFAGIRNASPEKIKILGFCPFKKTLEQEAMIKNNCINHDFSSWQLFSDEEWGGFGKMDKKLFEFMNDFYRTFRMPLDVIYTAKMMYYLKTIIVANQIPNGSHILAIHTGGLQGNASVKQYLAY